MANLPQLVGNDIETTADLEMAITTAFANAESPGQITKNNTVVFFQRLVALQANTLSLKQRPAPQPNDDPPTSFTMLVNPDQSAEFVFREAADGVSIDFTIVMNESTAPIDTQTVNVPIPGGATVKRIVVAEAAANNGKLLGIVNGQVAVVDASGTPTPTSPQFAAIVPHLTYTDGTAITAEVFPAATGFTDTPTYALNGQLPAGLSFTAATRTLAGTPSEVGSFTLNYTATGTNADGDSQTITEVANIVVAAAAATTRLAQTWGASATTAPVDADFTNTSTTNTIQPATSTLTSAYMYLWYEGATAPTTILVNTRDESNTFETWTARTLNGTAGWITHSGLPLDPSLTTTDTLEVR